MKENISSADFILFYFFYSSCNHRFALACLAKIGLSRDGGAWWAAVYGVAQSRT